MPDLRRPDVPSSTRRSLLSRLALWLGLPTIPRDRDATLGTRVRVVERRGWFLDARDR